MPARLSLAMIALVLALTGCSPTPSATVSQGDSHSPIPSVPAPVTNVNHSVDSFVYPYPHRTNPFTRPTQASGQNAADHQTPALEVRGFVDVGRLRVVLVDSKGLTMVLGESDAQGEVRVVKIHPPEVTVVRNGETMTLELSKP